MTHPAVVPSLRDSWIDAVRDALQGATDVALIDVPVHTNVGDAAIWLGERAGLAALGARVRYTCHLGSYRPQRLRRALGNGVILLHGGGNLGDLWPAHQALRERVLHDFPDLPIVQLPQTLCFTGDAALDRARRAFEGHGRFTLLLRDDRSFAAARAHFNVPARVCPDAAFCLEPHRSASTPDRPVLRLLRSDHESALGDAAPRESVDWLGEPATRLHTVARLLDRIAGDGAGPRRLAAAAAIRVHERLARRRLARGCALLASARVVISDRLHAHVLCLLLGVPHVMLEDRYGKVRAFVDTWTRESPLVRLARSADEAEDMASGLAGELSPWG